MSIKKSSYNNLNFLDKLKSTSIEKNKSSKYNLGNSDQGLLGKTLKNTINDKIAYYKTLNDKKRPQDISLSKDISLDKSKDMERLTTENNKIDIKISVNYAGGKVSENSNKANSRQSSQVKINTFDSMSNNKSGMSMTHSNNNSISKIPSKILNLKSSSTSIDKKMNDAPSNKNNNSNTNNKVIRTKSDYGSGMIQNNMNISLLTLTIDNKTKNENNFINITSSDGFHKSSTKSSPAKKDKPIANYIKNLKNTSFGYNPTMTDYGHNNKSSNYNDCKANFNIYLLTFNYYSQS